MQGLDIRSTWNEKLDLQEHGALCYFNNEDRRIKNYLQNIFCSSCNKRSFYCDSKCDCGSSIFKFRVRPQFQQLSKEPTKPFSKRWFHATTIPDWDKAVTEAQAMVHIGNIDTVLAVILQRIRPDGKDKFYLWEVAFDETSIAPWVCPDLDGSWIESSNMFHKNIGHDAVAYVNTFEAPGSISYIARPESLTMVKVHHFTYPEFISSKL